MPGFRIASFPKRRPERTLMRALDRLLWETGDELPSDIVVTIHKNKATLGRGMLHAMESAWSEHDPRIPHGLLVDGARRLSRRIRAARRHEHLLASIGHDAARSPPAWTMLIHPVALLLALADEPDRDRGYAPGGCGPWNIVDSHLRAGADGLYDFTRMMVRDHDATMVLTDLPQTDASPERVQFAISHALPPSACIVAAGMRLMDVVRFPSTGHADVDAAMRDVFIEKAVAHEQSTVFTLHPTAWLPYAQPPRAMRDWHLRRPTEL